MSVLDTFFALVAPYDCLGCGREGNLLCDKCTNALPAVVPRCYHCGKLAADWATCPVARRKSKLLRIKACTFYEGVAKDLIWKLKFEGAQAAAKEIAELMASLLADAPAEAIIVPAPTTSSRARVRGYDQSRLIARQLSRQTAHRTFPLLVRTGQHHQIGASAKVRREQLRDAFRVVTPSVAKGAHIILVDDVLTTGATLEAAAAALKKAGAKRVEAVVFARA